MCALATVQLIALRHKQTRRLAAGISNIAIETVMLQDSTRAARSRATLGRLSELAEFIAQFVVPGIPKPGYTPQTESRSRRLLVRPSAANGGDEHAD